VTALDGEHTINVRRARKPDRSFACAATVCRGSRRRARRSPRHRAHRGSAEAGKRERELLEEYAGANADEDGDRSFFDRVKEAFKAE